MDNKYIDDFFKSKLDEREIPFSEDAWLAAEQMIVKEERKRRWGGLGRLLFLLPFLIAGLILLAYQTQTAEFPVHQNGMTTVPFGSPNLRDNNAATLEQQESIRKENTESTVFTNTIENSALSEEEGASAVVAGTATLEETEKGQTTDVKSVEIKKDKIQPKKSASPSSVTKEKKEEVERPMAQVEFQTPIQKSDNDASSIATESLISKTSTLAGAETAVMAEEETYEKSRISTINLEAENYQLPAAALPVSNTTIRYSKINRLSAGLMTAAIFTPSFNDQIVGVSGMNIGGTFSYRLNSRWSANADLLYEFHGRNFAFPNGNNTLQLEYQSYGFGVDDKRLNVKVKQSHLITLPLYVKYHMGRSSLDLGIQLAYTLGLRGKIEEETISVNQTASTRQSKNSWIDSDEVSPYQFNVMLGYQFKISHRWSIGIRSVIVPSRLPRQGRNAEEAFNPLEEIGLIGEQNANGERTPIPLFEHNAINFHVGVKYNLNPKVRHITKPLMGL